MEKIVVVGGGMGGWAAVQALKKESGVEVTLIDRKDYFEVTYAQLRAVVDPDGIGTSSRISYAKAFPGRFVLGEVKKVDEGSVVLSDGTRLAFDKLILAPGSRYPRLPAAKPWDQTTLETRNAYNRAEFARFQAAAGYLVVGGGVVGIELAGELASAAPGKKVRLAHRGDRLAEALAPKASALAFEQLKALGVEILLNTADAKPLAGELLFEATSPEPTSGFLDLSVLDNRGRIKVDGFLRVEGHSSWYALGDASAVNDPKHGANAVAQAGYVVSHLMNQLQPKPKVLKPYKSGNTIALVPIGKEHGFTQLPFGVVRWKFLIDFKRKDFFIGRFQKEVGNQPASVRSSRMKLYPSSTVR